MVGGDGTAEEQLYSRRWKGPFTTRSVCILLFTLKSILGILLHSVWRTISSLFNISEVVLYDYDNFFKEFPVEEHLDSLSLSLSFSLSFGLFW